MEAIKIEKISTEEGKIMLNNLPIEKGDSLEITIRVTKKPEKPGINQDPILKLKGLGKDIWKGVNPDEYVRNLREEWV